MRDVALGDPVAGAGTSRTKRQIPRRAAARRVSPAAAAVSRRPPSTGPSPLKVVRTARGYSQLALARCVGIAVSTLNGIEQGLSLPTPALARQLADVLGVTPRTIFPAFPETSGGHDAAGHGPDQG